MTGPSFTHVGVIPGETEFLTNYVGEVVYQIDHSKQVYTCDSCGAVVHEDTLNEHHHHHHLVNDRPGTWL